MVNGIVAVGAFDAFLERKCQNGWMLAQSGRLDDGIRVLREARLRDPGNGIVRWHLASALVKAGRKMEAKDELKAALVSNNPPPPGPELSLLKAEVGL